MACQIFVIFPLFITFLAYFIQAQVYSAEPAPLYRARRDVASSYRTPQPTAEFPLVLFEGDNYNNGSEGVIHRSRPNEYRVWARTLATETQEFEFRSLFLMPGWKLTFQACCLAGNLWTRSVTNVTNITSLHFYMFDHPDVGEAIYYTQWLHWAQAFAVKAEACVDSDSCSPNVTCSGPCYFGSCGQDGNCQCKDGYSGDQCEIRPVSLELYPNLTYPLILFPEKDFQGTPEKVLPNNYITFAKNEENKRTFLYLSARVLFTRSITFSRKLGQELDMDETSTVSPGSDIRNLESFFASNRDIGHPLWMNYAETIEFQFSIKVEDNTACNNCSETGGSCYTGACICLTGYDGADCSNIV